SGIGGSELPEPTCSWLNWGARDLGGGLLIHSDPLALIDLRLFCLRYKHLSCPKTPHLQSIAHQVLPSAYQTSDCLCAPSLFWFCASFNKIWTRWRKQMKISNWDGGGFRHDAINLC